jgi:hypothetical protein
MLCGTNAPSFRKETCILTSNCEPRSVVVCKTTVAKARSVSVKGTLRTRTGRTFATMPQSNNQTSPRLGGTFFLMEHCCQRVACGSNRVIIERPRVPRRQMAHYFSHELLLFFDWQRLELGKQFCRSSAHSGKEYCTKSIVAKIDLPCQPRGFHAQRECIRPNEFSMPLQISRRIAFSSAVDVTIQHFDGAPACLRMEGAVGTRATRLRQHYVVAGINGQTDRSNGANGMNTPCWETGGWTALAAW